MKGVTRSWKEMQEAVKSCKELQEKKSKTLQGVTGEASSSKELKLQRVAWSCKELQEAARNCREL